MTSRGIGGESGPRDTVPPAPNSLKPDQSTVGTGPIRRAVRITNPLGLHHRAADRFCRAAKRFACTVLVWNGELRADGKNIWDLIGLVVLPGTEVTLEVDGPGAEMALDPLAAVLGSSDGEDYTI
jgi:phosphocarrier protein HPr